MKNTALTPIVGRMDHAAASQKFSMPPWYAARTGCDSPCTVAQQRNSMHIGGFPLDAVGRSATLA